MLLLENLCTGKLHANSVVIEDDTEAPCRSLVLVFLHHMCQRCDEVLLMAFERPPHFYLSALPAPLRQKVRVPVIPRPQRTGDRLAVGPLITAARQVIQGSGVKVGVVVDSVSDIVFTHSATAVPQLVRGLLDYRERGSKVEQVLSVFHPGVHDEATRQVVCGHPQAWIRLRPSPSPHHRYSCLLRHGDAGQKATVSTEEFNISANCLHVQDLVSVSKVDTVQETPAQPQQVDPAANLTFNLSLKPAEKTAKDQMILPYTQIASSDGQSGGGGSIHYIPDDDDDFDDEDPDDDLDF